MGKGKWEFFKGSKENWFSEPLYNWMDLSQVPEAPGLRERCTADRIRQALAPWSDLFLIKLEYFPEGTYQEKGSPRLTNVQSFYMATLEHRISDLHTAEMKILFPVRWNGRFMGIAGAGSNLSTPWDKEQTVNLTTWPMAIRNGFACALNDGGTGPFVDSGWGFAKDGDLEWDLMENWAHKGTHLMTQMAKAVVEAVYGRPIYKSYMHGTSGGGRQAVVEAVRYPQDYDGLWADGPLYDYYDLMFALLWAPVVIHNEAHHVSVEKYKAANVLARMEDFTATEPYSLTSPNWQRFLASLPGTKTKDGPITEEDLKVMIRMWNGPVLLDGSPITYGFGPEITQWPVGPRKFGYLKVHDDGSLSIIPFALQFIRWLTRDPDYDINQCSYEEFDRIYRENKKEFADYFFYDADLRAFALKGGKLIITHGTGDHVVPNQITRDYYKKARAYFASDKYLADTMRIFMSKRTGHALFDWSGPNVKNSSAWPALMAWVEKGQAPESLQTLEYNFIDDCVIRQDQVDYYKGE